MVTVLEAQTIAPAWGAPIGAAAVAMALWINTKRIGILPDDPPGGRKHHQRPLPMIGLLLGTLATVALWIHGPASLALGAGLCTVVGFLDDRRKADGSGLGLPFKVVALAIAAWLAVTSLGGAPLSPLTWVFAIGLAFVVINAINFLDNANGVAAAVGTVGLLLATGADGPFAIVAFLFVGFLPFNWPVPRVLLGDAGALCLGYALGATALMRATAGDGLSVAAALAPVAVPVLDFAQVVATRTYLGFLPWIADRRHLAHIAMNSGLPQVLVAPVFASLAAVLFLVLT